MTIDEAIKILKEGRVVPCFFTIEDVNEANQLGIEALHRCSEIRKYSPPGGYMPLPGETK